MSQFAEFLTELLNNGRMVFRGRPDFDNPGPDIRAQAVLRAAFDEYRLTLAGPLIDFDLGSALSAARFVEKAAWFLLSFAENAAQLQQMLAFAESPSSAVQHLSADLTLRYVPAILRRTRVLGGGDPLSAVLIDVLRRWPLSGVLAELVEAPVTALDFAGHRGLQLLYAERLADHFKPAWVPPAAEGEYLELVWIEAQKDPRLLSQPRETLSTDGE